MLVRHIRMPRMIRISKLSSKPWARLPSSLCVIQVLWCHLLGEELLVNAVSLDQVHRKTRIRRDTEYTNVFTSWWEQNNTFRLSPALSLWLFCCLLVFFLLLLSLLLLLLLLLPLLFLSLQYAQFRTRMCLWKQHDTPFPSENHTRSFLAQTSVQGCNHRRTTTNYEFMVGVDRHWLLHASFAQLNLVRQCRHAWRSWRHWRRKSNATKRLHCLSPSLSDETRIQLIPWKITEHFVDLSGCRAGSCIFFHVEDSLLID